MKIYFDRHRLWPAETRMPDGNGDHSIFIWQRRSPLGRSDRLMLLSATFRSIPGYAIERRENRCQPSEQVVWHDQMEKGWG